MPDETFKTLTEIGLEKWQADFVNKLYEEGVRSGTLEDQPAPWVILGLQALERGEKVDENRIRNFNEAHTDPDPWFH